MNTRILVAAMMALMLPIQTTSAQTALSFSTKPETIAAGTQATKPLSVSASKPLSQTITKTKLDPKKVEQYLKNIPAGDRLKPRDALGAKIFEDNAPAVVFVLVNDGAGSGSLISSDGYVLTNWHVIEGYEEAMVLFHKEGTPNPQDRIPDMIKADVIKIDELTDLALLKLHEVPAGAPTIKLGDRKRVRIGEDVHVIGHPLDYDWSYTKGVISQFRHDYQWPIDDNRMHQAKVVQTQTPINPGNSGGPLLTDSGELVGVVAFTRRASQGLNFAISIEEVRNFMERKESRLVPKQKISFMGKAQSSCRAEVVEEGRNKTDDADLYLLDWDCDGKGDWLISDPDDDSKPRIARRDSSNSGRYDTFVLDWDRDGSWDRSYYLVDEDDNVDQVGFHEDGSLEPTRVVPYIPGA